MGGVGSRVRMGKGAGRGRGGERSGYAYNGSSVDVATWTYVNMVKEGGAALLLPAVLDVQISRGERGTK